MYSLDKIYIYLDLKNLKDSKILKVPSPLTSDVYSGISKECPTWLLHLDYKFHSV